MTDHYFFGYGSLVNQRTHSYLDCRPARVRGWQRAWVSSARRGRSFLSAVPAEDGEIDGLIASVPNGDWSALDARERAYLRIPIERGTLSCDPHAAPDAQIYQANPEFIDAVDSRKPVLLSYIDVVVQGYLEVYGHAGVEAFFATTRGWDAPIRDDRAQPVYTLAQKLTETETALVDRHLERVNALILHDN